MFCKKCGKEIPNGSTFCVACGNKVEDEKIVIVREKTVIENCKVGLGCAITSFIMTLLSLMFGCIPLLGLVYYILFMVLAYCFAIPGFIVSLIKIIKKKRLGAAITAMCFTVVSFFMNIFFYAVIIELIESLA